MEDETLATTEPVSVDVTVENQEESFIEQITVTELHSIRDDLVNTNLFCSAMITGALCASVLFRRWLK